MNVNLKSTFAMVQLTIELLRKVEKGANILMISSIHGLNPSAFNGLYGTTKAAIENMVKWMKDELREDGIRVNAVAPGAVDTDMLAPVRSFIPEKALGTSE